MASSTNILRDFALLQEFNTALRATAQALRAKGRTRRDIEIEVLGTYQSFLSKRVNPYQDKAPTGVSRVTLEKWAQSPFEPARSVARRCLMHLDHGGRENGTGFPYSVVAGALSLGPLQGSLGDMISTCADGATLQQHAVAGLLMTSLSSEYLRDRAVTASSGIRVGGCSRYLRDIHFEIDDEHALGTEQNGNSLNGVFDAADALLRTARQRSRTSVFEQLLEVSHLRSDGEAICSDRDEAAHMACWSLVANTSLLTATRAILCAAEANPALADEPLTRVAEEVWRIAYSSFEDRLALCEHLVDDLAVHDLPSAKRAAQTFQLAFRAQPRILFVNGALVETDVAAYMSDFVTFVDDDGSFS